jgi:hypothetical protein
MTYLLETGVVSSLWQALNQWTKLRYRYQSKFYTPFTSNTENMPCMYDKTAV